MGGFIFSAAVPCYAAPMTIGDLRSITAAFPSTEKMPVLFVGHGSPMNGIEDNRWSRAWRDLGTLLPRPSAVLCVSAHWLSEGTFVHVAEQPRTIHDFWGFPPELYAVRYPCPGAPAHAEEARRTVSLTDVGPDTSWGVDHGTWSIARRLFPEADVPIFQMSIWYAKPAQWHHDLGRELSALRRKGILIVGSGNLVHNLGMVEFSDEAAPFDWAVEFDAIAKDALLRGDDAPLIGYAKLGPAAKLSVPTPDHYWPLIVALGARDKDDAVTFPVEGLSNASISMRSVAFGL